MPNTKKAFSEHIVAYIVAYIHKDIVLTYPQIAEPVNLRCFDSKHLKFTVKKTIPCLSGESKMTQYCEGGGARYSGGHDIRGAGIGGGVVLQYIAKYLIIVVFNRTINKLNPKFSR